MEGKPQGKYVIYSRKSKFTGKGESIENQIELCRDYIDRNYGKKAAEEALVYEDEGFSGGTLERPQFKKMMADSKKLPFAAIVVYRLDRISRNIGDFAGLIKYLDERNIAFISIREVFDTASPMGKAMMFIASVFSQLERETAAERIRDNMQELSKTGRWLGGVTPTGYASEQVERVTVDGKVRKACKLQPIPEETELVKLIFSKFMETNSLTKTDEFLLEHGYVTKNKKHFSRFAIRAILTNPVYMKADEDALAYLEETQVDLFSPREDFDGEHGVMTYNRTLQKAGKANQIRPMEEWIVSVGAHPGLIDGADWVRVQTMLEQNRDKGYRKPRSNVALLSGLVICGDCGDYMRPKLTQRKNAKGELIYTYGCTMKERSRGKRCNIRGINGNLLDAMVLEELKKLPEDGSEFLRQLEQAKKQFGSSREEYDEQLDRFRKAVAEKDKEITGLMSALARAAGTPSEEYILRQIDALHQEGEGARKRLEELEQVTAKPALTEREFELLRQIVSSFALTVDAMSVEEKRAAIRICVKKIVWDGEDVHIYLFGSEGEADFGPDDRSGPEGPDAPRSPLGENSK